MTPSLSSNFLSQVKQDLKATKCNFERIKLTFREDVAYISIVLLEDGLDSFKITKYNTRYIEIEMFLQTFDSPYQHVFQGYM